ncbi:MAG: hypothetical protein QJR03_09995 [Sphaerobacter sp.]|nr:hypothetical protein [Sphaerobacter sp.]
MDRTDDVIEQAPEGASAAQAPQAASGGDGFDLGRIRELILAAHPDVVPDLITGATFDELMASIEPARAAYARIVASLREQPTAAPGIPAGQPGRQPVIANVEAVSPRGKIAEGLRRRRG